MSENFELVVNFITRFCAAGIEVIYYTYSIELYPTPVRGIAFGVNAAFGNGGSIIAPFLYEFLFHWVFCLLFGIVCVLNGSLLMFLPETVGKPMNETIDEIEKEKEKNKRKEDEENRENEKNNEQDKPHDNEKKNEEDKEGHE